MNLPELCPFCHNTSVASGRFFLGDVYGPPGFEPDEIHLSPLRKAVATSWAILADRAKACVHCGKVWGDLDLDQLKNLFRKYGTDESKARLTFDLSS